MINLQAQWQYDRKGIGNYRLHIGTREYASVARLHDAATFNASVQAGPYQYQGGSASKEEAMQWAQWQVLHQFALLSSAVERLSSI